METAAAAPGKMAAAKSGAGGASRPALLILREDSLQEVSFSSVRAFPNSDGCSLEGTSSNPPVCPSQGASVHHPLPTDWPVPQALHGPAYLSAETSSAVMAAVAVDSAAIVPLSGGPADGTQPVRKNKTEFRTPETCSGTENGRLETPRGWVLLYSRALRPAYPLPDPPPRV